MATRANSMQNTTIDGVPYYLYQPQNSYQSMYGQLEGVYRSALGRGAGDADVPSWLRQGSGGAWEWTVPDWEQQIRNSPEAQAYAARQPAAHTSSALAGDWSGFGNAWTASGGRTVQDLANFIAANPGYGAQVYGSKGDKVQIGGRIFDAVIAAGAGGQGASWYDVTNGDNRGSVGGVAPVNTATPYANDPAAELYYNTILSRMQQLQQPVNDPFLPLLQQQALERVASLKGQPFTDAESAAMLAQLRDPLTQARDAAYRMNREQASARGFLPSSGLLRDLDLQTQEQYMRGIADVENQRSVMAINEKTRRAQEALSILASLVTAEENKRNEYNARANELVDMAARIPGMDERRLALLTQAADSGMSGTTSALSNLSQLLQSQSQEDWKQWAINDDNNEAIGTLIAQIAPAIAALGK